MIANVLGPLRVTLNGGSVVPAAPKARKVSALLVLNRGRVVQIDAMEREVWGAAAAQERGHQPAELRDADPQAPGMALPGGPGSTLAKQVLITEQTGYRLAVPDDEFDVRRYQDRVAEAGRAEEAGPSGPGLGAAAVCPGPVARRAAGRPADRARAAVARAAAGGGPEVRTAPPYPARPAAPAVRSRRRAALVDGAAPVRRDAARVPDDRPEPVRQTQRRACRSIRGCAPPWPRGSGWSPRRGSRNCRSRFSWRAARSPPHCRPWGCDTCPPLVTSRAQRRGEFLQQHVRSGGRERKEAAALHQPPSVGGPGEGGPPGQGGGRDQRIVSSGEGRERHPEAYVPHGAQRLAAEGQVMGQRPSRAGRAPRHGARPAAARAARRSHPVRRPCAAAPGRVARSPGSPQLTTTAPGCRAAPGASATATASSAPMLCP